MMPTLLMLLPFLTAAFAVLGVYSLLSDLWLGDRDLTSRRVEDRFGRRAPDQDSRPLFKDLGRVTAELVTARHEAAAGLWRQFELLVRHAGLGLAPGQVLGVAAGAGLGLGVLAGVLGRGLLPGAAGATLGAGGPLLYVSFRGRARLERLLAQLPRTLDLMARALRGGQGVTQAMRAVADELPDPVGAEFACCWEQQHLGLPLDVAVRELARRTGLLEMRILAMAILVQQQTGGNLAELLDRLGALVRERLRVRGLVKSLTAEGRLQAAVLLALPPALVVIMLVVKPSYIHTLLVHPGLLAGTVVSQVVGAVWIWKTVNFEG